MEKFRLDYKPLPVKPETVSLNFLLDQPDSEGDSTHAIVQSSIFIRAIAGQSVGPEGLFLNGRDDVTLVSVGINDSVLASETYTVTGEGLTLSAEVIPQGSDFTLSIVTRIKPQDNTLLEGLYRTNGTYCTQCEAEGFRGITFFFDRPDVMCIYTTRIEANKAESSILLSNGNLQSSGDIEGNPARHFSVWLDPFPKPCYLFALVAGNLAVSEDKFTTQSGRDVLLRIFVQEREIGKVSHAMQSLKKAMKWDEVTFGLEYDLDLFNIVAVPDFNMGAMENKSLNVFNSRLILATPEAASDTDFDSVEAVVGHEYFHNWTGNRVTCRDWFQLTLKEGLTVYRDQEFTADMNSRPVKRLQDVAMLRTHQFSEDGGAMAHPVRPDSYISMDNFYTVTVYEKGAELIRMYEAVLGKAGFRRGMDLYFQRHDGQAVTCDDFLSAMADANGEDLSALSVWYSQSGTPVLTVTPTHNPTEGTLSLKMSQAIPVTAKQPSSKPCLIPVRTALLLEDGSLLPLRLRAQDGSVSDLGTETVLRFTQSEETFIFEVGAGEKKIVPSLLRGFSAPVKLVVEGQTEADLTHILTFDTDGFNRYDAGQVLAKKLILSLYHATLGSVSASTTSEELKALFEAAGGVSGALVGAYRALLVDDRIDDHFRSYAITLPSHSEMVEEIELCDPLHLHHVISFISKSLAENLRSDLEAVIARASASSSEPYSFNPVSVGARAIVNKAYGYLVQLGDSSVEARVLSRMQSANNMTDEISALASLNFDCASKALAFEQFYGKWKDEPLVLLKLFRLHATCNTPGNVSAIQRVSEMDCFHHTNPNSVYSLYNAFAASPVNFHAADGSGYAFMAESVLKMDKINRQVASRLVKNFTTWANFDLSRQEMIKTQLKKIVSTEGLSNNVYEIASKSIN